MTITSLNASTYSQLYQSLPPGARIKITATEANGNQLSESIGNPLAADDADNVSISDAAQGMQAASISPSFLPEEQLLTTLADKSLTALGIAPVADDAGTQITFDSVSYGAVSLDSASAGPQSQTSAGSQSIVQSASDDGLALMGSGEIETADGQEFQFQIELQLGQSTDFGSAVDPQIADSLAGESGVSGSPNAQAGNNLQLGANSQQAFAISVNPGNQYITQPATPAMIDWDALRRQSDALFDMLSSLGNSPEVVATATSATFAASASSTIAVSDSDSTSTAAVAAAAPADPDAVSTALPAAAATALATVATPVISSSATATSVLPIAAN